MSNLQNTTERARLVGYRYLSTSVDSQRLIDGVDANSIKGPRKTKTGSSRMFIYVQWPEGDIIAYDVTKQIRAQLAASGLYRVALSKKRVHAIGEYYLSLKNFDIPRNQRGAPYLDPISKDMFILLMQGL